MIHKTCFVPCLSTMLLLATVLAVPASAQLQDRIYLRSNPGQPTSGVIDDVTATIVTMRVNSVARKIDVNTIDRILFADEPSELQQARAMLRRNQLEAAQVMLDKLTGTDQGNAWVRQDIQYYNALITARLSVTGRADKNKAGTLLNGIISEHANCYHFFAAVEMFGDLAASVGQFDAAVESYKKVGLAPWPEYKIRAAVLEAGALVGKGESAEALAKFEQVAAINPENDAMRALKSRAQAGKARCLGLTGDQAAGITLTYQIIKDTDPKTQQLVMALAYNAQGACFLADQQPQEALLSYLHTAEMFYQDPETHAEALYQLSKLWELAKKSDRANRARGLLRERYGDSLWAKKP
jgi:tetratricopeptide (TPR) repeat protein